MFGLVSGTFIRSSNVTTDSASCARRLSGLKSKRKPASSGKPRIVAASVVPTIQLRRFSRKRSRNASAAKPIGFCSAGGLSTVSKAGSRVNVVASAMMMPIPAIRPSSERPRYAVGRNEKNAVAIEAAASRSGVAIPRAVPTSAGSRSRDACRSDR